MRDDPFDPTLDRDLAVSVIVTEDGRYLLQLRDDLPGVSLRGHWGLFGGALEAGETAEQALRRLNFFVVSIQAADVDGLQQSEGAGRALFTVEEAARLEKIGPWDLQAVMLHAHGPTLFAHWLPPE
jgi:hypothetical protein